MTRWEARDIPDQSGKTILITGANSGLGLRSAEALARKGARVLLACRDAEKAAAALDAVHEVATGPEPEVVPLDLADLESVRRAATDVAQRTETLDVLMNNAGVMATPYRQTPDGFELQLGTNHLGHFALTGLLLPLVKGGRVVNTSSQVHRMGRMRWDDLQWTRRYERWQAYGQSKLANLLFTFELARRAGDELVVAAGHPGYSATHLQAAGPEMSGNKVMARIMDAMNAVVAQSDEKGALPQLYAATMPDVRSGDYFGPDGLFERAGYPKRVGTSKAARNEADARRLWEESERLTAVTFHL